MNDSKTFGVIRDHMSLLSLPCLLFVGCTNVPKVIRQQPLKPGPKSHAIMLERVAAKLDRGAPIGTAYPLGLPPQPLSWQGGRVSFNPDQYSDEVRSKFKAVGLNVVGDPKALFEDPSSHRADFLIGALICDLKMSLVFPFAQYGNYDVGSGSAYIEVEWQIFEQRSRSVQLRINSKGSAHNVDLKGTGSNEPVMQAFGVAAQNLLAEKSFMDLVAPTDECKPSDRPSSIFLDLPDVHPGQGSIQVTIDHARASVLTVFRGTGHGSGFIISKNGYLLTNQHVVGDARNVTAKTLAGRELQGEVIRIDRVRDVALVKLEQDQYQPLLLGNTASARPGTDVYAIGSPKEEEFGQSVSKGVVSGFRSLNDQRFIQSDVAINPGNSGGPLLSSDCTVIGIAVSGLTDAQGINFFIPIEDAINALGIVDSISSSQPTSKAADNEVRR